MVVVLDKSSAALRASLHDLPQVKSPAPTNAHSNQNLTNHISFPDLAFQRGGFGVFDFAINNSSWGSLVADPPGPILFSFVPKRWIFATSASADAKKSSPWCEKVWRIGHQIYPNTWDGTSKYKSVDQWGCHSTCIQSASPPLIQWMTAVPNGRASGTDP